MGWFWIIPISVYAVGYFATFCYLPSFWMVPIPDWASKKRDYAQDEVDTFRLSLLLSIVWPVALLYILHTKLRQKALMGIKVEDELERGAKL